MMTQYNPLSKLITKHSLKRIDPKKVACKTITNQSRRAVRTGAGEATRARTVPTGKEAADGARGEMD
jgi:hypothetical protein